MTPTPHPAPGPLDRFGWLLRREWMQHHRGWLVLAGIPALLALLVLPFGTIEVDEVPPAALLAAIGLLAYVALVMVLAWSAVLFQAPGLARRDQQDRSIEFWLSLPTGHGQSIGATVLMHLVLMPLLVMLIAFACGQLVAMGLVLRLTGLAGLGELSLLPWLTVSAVALLRLLSGMLLAALWTAPLVLMAMAASAWLKRWGLPALVAVVALGSLFEQQTWGTRRLWMVVSGWFGRGTEALLPFAWPDFKRAVFDQADPVAAFQQWLWKDTGRIFTELASPAFALALAVAALGFGLLVLRRSGALGWPRGAQSAA